MSLFKEYYTYKSLFYHHNWGVLAKSNKMYSQNMVYYINGNLKLIKKPGYIWEVGLYFKEELSQFSLIVIWVLQPRLTSVRMTYFWSVRILCKFDLEKPPKVVSPQTLYLPYTIWQSTYQRVDEARGLFTPSRLYLINCFGPLLLYLSIIEP